MGVSAKRSPGAKCLQAPGRAVNLAFEEVRDGEGISSTPAWWLLSKRVTVPAQQAATATAGSPNQMPRCYIWTGGGCRITGRIRGNSLGAGATLGARVRSRY
jgi:hypothetical protein